MNDIDNNLPPRIAKKHRLGPQNAPEIWDLKNRRKLQEICRNNKIVLSQWNNRWVATYTHLDQNTIELKKHLSNILS